MQLALTLAASLALGALAVLAPARAHACSCMQTTLSDAYAAAVAVFEGHVLQVQRVEPTPSAPGYRSVRMQVVRAWKGAEGEEVVITTPADSAGCGYDFSAEQSYLVYAGSHGGGLQVTLCSRTRPIADAGEDLKALGLGATPVDPKKQDTPGIKPAARKAKPDEPPARGGCAGCAVESGRTPVPDLGFLLGLLLLRRRPRRTT